MQSTVLAVGGAENAGHEIDGHEIGGPMYQA